MDDRFAGFPVSDYSVFKSDKSLDTAAVLDQAWHDFALARRTALLSGYDQRTTAGIGWIVNARKNLPAPGIGAGQTS